MAFELTSFSAGTLPLQLCVARGLSSLGYPGAGRALRAFPLLLGCSVPISGICPPGGVRLWGITECLAF